MNYLLQTVLSTKYNFIAAADIFSGIEAIKKSDDISLVLFDTDHIEDGDARDFIELVTTSGLYQKPVIVLSSENRKNKNEKKVEYFVKPFSPSDLIRKIDKMTLSEIVSN